MYIKQIKSGVILTSIFAIVSILLSNTTFISSLGISALVIAIIFGMIFTNLFNSYMPKSLNNGIEFSAKKILRLAIVLYGFRITMQEIAAVGTHAILLDAVIITTTFLLAIIVGIKVLKLDKESVILIGAGSSICGAAAVLATEGSLKSESYKSVIAVSTVVIFGTIAMFVYPILFNYLDISQNLYGIYTGATIHEVAQVVVAASAIGAISAKSAVIVKMTRVIMLAPFLIIVSAFFSNKATKITIPWFAFGFLIVIGFNSLELLSPQIVNTINLVDTFLLAMAMSALGLETKLYKFKQAGIKPFILAFILFIWLVVGGYFLCQAIY